MGSAENTWDKLLQIKTTGRDDSHADQYYHPYEPTSYEVLKRFAQSGYINKQNRLIDYGCGKGRVSFFLSYQTKCNCIGIEFDERIITRAMDNKDQAISGKRVELIHGRAEAYEVPADVDRAFFFNPFSLEIFQKVLGRIMESYYENPREFFLCFYYPSDEYIGYLMTRDHLMFVDEIACQDLFDGENKRERILIFEIAG